MVNHTNEGRLYYTDDWQAYTFLENHGVHVVINKEKAGGKAETVQMERENSGSMRNLGCTSMALWQETGSIST